MGGWEDYGVLYFEDNYSISSRLVENILSNFKLFLRVRPVSALDLYLQQSHHPQRVSTLTCPGSNTSLSLFQCPHDCFTETDVTEDTIEEMDEDDLDSLNRLVRLGLDVGTDCSSYRQVKHIKSYRQQNYSE